MFDNITTASVTQTPHPICTHSRGLNPPTQIHYSPTMLWDLWASSGIGGRERENMHWLKAPDSPIQSRPKEHQLFCILTQRLITRKCVPGWQMQMETDSDKNDNGIGLEGVTEVEAGCCLKYLIIDTGGSEMLFDPGGVWMSSENCQDFEVKYINDAWRKCVCAFVSDRACVCVCVFCRGGREVVALWRSLYHIGTMIIICLQDITFNIFVLFKAAVLEKENVWTSFCLLLKASD